MPLLRLILLSTALTTLTACDPAELFREDPIGWIYGTWGMVEPYPDEVLALELATRPTVTFSKDMTYVTSWGYSGRYQVNSGPNRSDVEFADGEAYLYPTTVQSGETGDRIELHNSRDGTQIIIRRSNIEFGVAPFNGHYVKLSAN